MSVDLPQNLLESAHMPLPELLNFTPLHFAEKKKESHGKLYVRILMFLLVVGIFTPSFIYFYRTSSARTLTSDREFMQDIANASQARRLASSDTAPSIETQTEETNIIIEVIDSIKRAIEKIVGH